jgi:hypothetical protein
MHETSARHKSGAPSSPIGQAANRHVVNEEALSRLLTLDIGELRQQWDDAALWGGFGTNVIPRRISREAPRAGYVELMHDLYVLDAYFGRLGNLYLDTRLQMGQARARYLRRHPLRRFKLNARLLAEAAAIFLLLRDCPP